MNLKYVLFLSAVAIPFAASADVLNFDLSGTSSYVAEPYGGGITTMGPPGTYAYVAAGVTPYEYHTAWSSSPLMNPDSSQPAYMLVNGWSGGIGGQDLWSKDFTIGAGTSTFNFGGTSVYSGENSPGLISLTVAGHTYTDSVNMPWNGGVFVQHSISFYIENPGTYTVTLQDANSGYGGNDFALAAPVPEPAPYAALGLGAIALLRRRAKKA